MRKLLTIIVLCMLTGCTREANVSVPRMTKETEQMVEQMKQRKGYRYVDSMDLYLCHVRDGVTYVLSPHVYTPSAQVLFVHGKKNLRRMQRQLDSRGIKYTPNQEGSRYQLFYQDSLYLPK